MSFVEFNEFEAEVIRDTLNEALWRTGLGFENFDFDSNPDVAAKVATMMVVVSKIERELEHG